jgi:hypothetical protein
MTRLATIFKSRLSCSAFFCLWLVSQINAQDTASWLGKEITMDGLPSEWKQTDLKKDSKAGHLYCIANDSSILYIGLLLKDEILKTKFSNAGFSIFLNSEGKEKKSFSVDFPLPDAENDIASDPARLMDLKGIQYIGMLHANQYRLSGFKEGNGKQNTSDENKNGVQLALGITDSAFLFYEVKIPLPAIFKQMTSFKEINQQNIAVCFSFNAMTKPSGQSSQSSNSGVPPGPVSARGGRGATQPDPQNSGFPARSSAGQDFGEMEKLFHSSKTWKTVSLAKPI